jgi:hypothetical protein
LLDTAGRFRIQRYPRLHSRVFTDSGRLTNVKEAGLVPLPCIGVAR